MSGRRGSLRRQAGAAIEGVGRPKSIETSQLVVDPHAISHCCTLSWSGFTVMLTPRSGGAIKFNVYKGSEYLQQFGVKDKLGRVKEKVEAQLSHKDWHYELRVMQRQTRPDPQPVVSKALPRARARGDLGLDR